MAIVEVNQVQVAFGEKTAVSAASFSIEKGETFSLIGESGCGKSTILRVLAGLQRVARQYCATGRSVNARATL